MTVSIKICTFASQSDRNILINNFNMGCDIHLRLEKRLKKEKKIVISPEIKNENGNVVKKELTFTDNDLTWHSCNIIPYGETWGDRVYGMFAVLADVRNYWGSKPIENRGFPIDANINTINNYMFKIATWLPDDAYEDDDGFSLDGRLISKNKAKEFLKRKYKCYEYKNCDNNRCSFKEVTPTDEWFSNYEDEKIKFIEDPDYHSPNWCSVSEMEECIEKVFKNENGEWNGDYIEWMGLLGAMKGYETSGEYEVRAVFWFDN